jgi:hypothetical protein
MPNDTVTAAGEAMPVPTFGKLSRTSAPLWSLFADPFLRDAFRRASGGPGPAPAAAAPSTRPKPLKPAGEALALEAADA